jgi:hypothetical protein
MVLFMVNIHTYIHTYMVLFITYDRCLYCIGPIYNTGDLKRICEIDLGVVSQCCCAKQVFKMNKQILANLALKINVKAGFSTDHYAFFVCVAFCFGVQKKKNFPLFSKRSEEGTQCWLMQCQDAFPW